MFVTCFVNIRTCGQAGVSPVFYVYSLCSVECSMLI